jgi:hypothetical protein
LKSFIKQFSSILFLILMITHCGNGKQEQNQDQGKTNTPPTITEVSLLPLNPTVQTRINAQILSTDKEGNPVTYVVKWFLNGNEIGEGMSLIHDEVQKGDKIFAEVTPYDGKDYGKPVVSNEITIGGSPPKIVSVQIAPESLFVTTPQVVVTVLAEDPDKDSVRIIIHWIVKNNVIPDTINVLNLKKFDLKKNDVITGSAFVDDGDFRSEPFLFELVIANAPPVFSREVDSVKCSPDNISYKLPIFDPDGDAIIYELIDAPTGIVIDENTGTISGNAGQATSFEVMIRATDTEGAYIEAAFTLTSP